MISFLDNEGLRYYDERLKAWVEAKVEESGSASTEKIAELDKKVKTKVANSLDMSLDEATYVLTVKLLSESGEELSKATVDLPIEELIKDGRYDDTTKEIVLILENGKEIRVPVGDLVENKLNKTTETNKLYGTESRGYQYLYEVSEEANSYSIPRRSNTGKLKSSYPVDEDDVATKQSVSDGLSKKLNRVNKESDYLSVYAVNKDGSDGFLKQKSDKAQAWSVPLRFRQGQILAARSDIETDSEKLKDSDGNPVDTDNFVVTQGQLKEVGTKVSSKLDKTNSTYILYGTTGKDDEGNTHQSELSFRSTVSGNSIAQRTDDGRLKVADPTEDNDAVSKRYFDENASSNINEKDETNQYYPLVDSDEFNAARNSISGSESVVGSRGYKINEGSFREGSFGYLYFKAEQYPETDVWADAVKFRCYQYNDVQTFTSIDKARFGDNNSCMVILTDETPYLYSADVYGFTKVEFLDVSDNLIYAWNAGSNLKLETVWYGCVNTGVIPRQNTSVESFLTTDEENNIVVDENKMGAVYYVSSVSTVVVVEPNGIVKSFWGAMDDNGTFGADDIYSVGSVCYDVISKCWGKIVGVKDNRRKQQNSEIAVQAERADYIYTLEMYDDDTYPSECKIENTPTCIKINNNYDSGTRQSYIDRGFKEDLSDADECLLANTVTVDGQSYITLTLKACHGHKGWGLPGKLTFSNASHIRFPDQPAIGKDIVGNGFNNVRGDKVKATFDYGFSTGYNNNSIGRYSITGGTRNIAAYASIALGNHNTVLGQSALAAGATNVITESGTSSIALGQENIVSRKDSIASGRGNKISSKYSAGFGYKNKIKGDSSAAFGYTNVLNDEAEFVAGVGNTANGRGSAVLGAVNQGLGAYGLVGGYTNKTTTDYNFLAGLHNTVDWATCSVVVGKDNKIQKADDAATSDGVGHLVVGSSNILSGGRNVILGGQSSKVKLRDSIAVGNNLLDESNSYGKAIFGNYNKQSDASIILGSGTNKDGTVTRQNAFEVYSNGKVITPNASSSYSDTDTKRLTTKEYVDNKVNSALILTSPNGAKFKITVADDGTLSAEKVE